MGIRLRFVLVALITLSIRLMADIQPCPTPPPTLPPDPRNLSANPDPYTSGMSLAWDTGGGSTGGFLIVANAGNAPANCTGGVRLDATSRNYSMGGLIPQTSYCFRICSIDVAPTPNTSPGVTVCNTTQGYD